MNTKKNHYLDAPVTSTLIKTGISMLPGTLAMSAYGIVDTYFVGFLGTNALAAMGYCFPIMMIINCIYHGLSTGMMTILSHALGESDGDKARRISGMGLLLVMLVSGVVAVAGIILTPIVLENIDLGAEVSRDVERYLTIWFWGNPIVALSFVLNRQLITLGKPKAASAWIVSGMLMNAVIDPFFIFGLGWFPAMGVAGASLATVVAQVFSSIGALMEVRRGIPGLISLQYKREDFPATTKAMMQYAIPAFLGIVIMPFANFVMIWVASGFGNEAVAAIGAADRLEMIAFVVPMSMGMSLVPLMAQNYGAGRFDRIEKARKFSIGFSVVYLGLFALIFVIWGDRLASIFTDDPEVIRIVQLYFLFIAWALAPQESHRFSSFVFMALKRPNTAAALNLFRNIVLFIPLALLAIPLQSLAFLFFARLFADVVAAIISFVMARRFSIGLLQESQKAL